MIVFRERGAVIYKLMMIPMADNLTQPENEVKFQKNAVPSPIINYWRLWWLEETNVKGYRSVAIIIATHGNQSEEHWSLPRDATKEKLSKPFY